MNNTYRIEVNTRGLLLCKTHIFVAGKNIVMESIMDTGAGTCHMSYGLWESMGLNEVCFNRNTELMKLMGIKSAEDMTFDSMPLKAKETELGNSTKVKTYEFRIDKLILGAQTVGNRGITFKGITVRIVDSKKLYFLTGWNILKYLNISYIHSTIQSICEITLNANGELLLNNDRLNKINNYMESTFNYLGDEEIKERDYIHDMTANIFGITK